MDSDRQCHPGDLREVVAKEPRIGEDGVVGKGLDAGSGPETGSWLVEGDVAVGADATQEQLDAAGGLDLLLVLVAFSLEVRGVAIEDVDIGRVHVDMREEVLVHEAVVALWVVSRDPDIFVLRAVRHFSKPCYAVQHHRARAPAAAAGAAGQ